MQRAFNLIDQLRDVVHVQPGPPLAKIPRFDSEGSMRPRVRRTCQTTTKGFVHHVAERATSPAGEGFKLRCDILVEGQRRSHTLMLS